jgi:predicted membrane channel-forming protein YqfA (hemolysin III family)
MNDSYIQAPDVSQESDHSWSFTDIGKTRLLSRDFSSHSTDEVFNSVSHLSGAMLSLLGSTLLITGASARGEVWKIVAFSIYGACLSGMFFCSVLHHSINSTEKVSDGMIIDNC